MQKPTVSHILLLSLPLILANCIVPILSLLNVAIVGHLSNTYALAGIALAGSIFNFLFNICNFLRMSTTGLVAQSINQPEKIRLIIARAILLAFLIGLVLIAIHAPLGELIFSFIHTSPQVARQAYSYFSMNIWSAPAELCLFVITGWLVALKKTHHAFYLVLLLIAIAAPLGWVLIDVLGFNAAGIALANVVATFFVVLLGLFWLQQEYHFLQQRLPLRHILRWKDIKPTLSLNGNVFIRTLSLMLVYSSFTLHAAKYGPLVLAANAILMNLLMFTFYGLDGVANITESFVGIALGSQKTLKLILKNTFISAFIVALLFSLIYGLFGQDFIRLLTTITPVQIVTTHYLSWAVLFPVVSVAAFWMDGVFVGALKGKAMRNTMLLATLSYFLILCLTIQWQDNGLWLAFLCFMIFRAVIQAVYMNQADFFAQSEQ